MLLPTPEQVYLFVSPKRDRPDFVGMDGGMLAPVVREQLNSGILTGVALFPASWAQRNPMLLFRFVGLFLLRLAHRRLFALLFHDPPRNTRCSESAPLL